jgi:hypothetical protein
MFAGREWVDAGGLISYGPDLAAMFRRIAEYVDRIARGAAPSALPLEQPTKFELVVNLKTAKALGIEIQQSIFARANDVLGSVWNQDSQGRFVVIQATDGPTYFERCPMGEDGATVSG